MIWHINIFPEKKKIRESYNLCDLKILTVHLFSTNALMKFYRSKNIMVLFLWEDPDQNYDRRSLGSILGDLGTDSGGEGKTKGD